MVASELSRGYRAHRAMDDVVTTSVDFTVSIWHPTKVITQTPSVASAPPENAQTQPHGHESGKRAAVIASRLCQIVGNQSRSGQVCCNRGEDCTERRNRLA